MLITVATNLTLEVVSDIPWVTSRTSPITSGVVVSTPVTPDVMSLNRPIGLPRKSTDRPILSA